MYHKETWINFKFQFKAKGDIFQPAIGRQSRRF